MKKDREKRKKAVDILSKSVYNIGTMQVSPSGMAAASQAVPGEFDSRHLLQNRSRTSCASYFYFDVDNVGESNSEGEFCV